MKDLIRMRHQIDVYYNMSSQLKSMSMQLGTIHATAEISKALRLATATMTHVNERMNIREIQQITRSFAREQAKMEGNQDAVPIPRLHSR
jgi:hypothetical protein